MHKKAQDASEGKGLGEPKVDEQMQHEASNVRGSNSTSAISLHGKNSLEKIHDLVSNSPELIAPSSMGSHSPSQIRKDIGDLTSELNGLLERVLELKGMQNRVQTEESACAKDVAAKEKALRECMKQVQKLHDDKTRDELSATVKALLKELFTTKSLLPRTPNLFLRASLGSAYFVLPEAWKIRYKTEYENFKLYMTIYSLAFALLNLFLFSGAAANYWLDVMYFFSLLYFYWTVTLREHILLVNGSRMRPWWMMHHYLSIALVGTILIWPHSSVSFQSFRDTFYWFCIYVSALQYLQYRYQMNRLYTLRALSKIGPMDVTTDSAQVHIRNNLTFLLPFLLIAQGFQLYNSWALFQMIINSASVEWQLVVCCMLFFLLAIGNIGTTLLTYYQKVKKTFKQD